MKRADVAVASLFMSKNAFEVFEISPDFIIDENALRQKFFKLQKEFHPDSKFADAVFSSQINDAYNILKSPLSRAEELLKLNGITVNHQVNSSNTVQPSKSTLEHAMEWREELSKCNSTTQLNELKTRLTEIYNRIINDLSACEFNENSAQKVIMMRYIDKILDEIKDGLKRYATA
jgi:molecular chaperone HscB